MPYFLQQIRVGLETSGKALHLSVLRAVVDGGSTIHVVVAQLGTCHYVLHVDIVAVASSTAGGDDVIGMHLIDHTLSTQGGIHLADAAFPDYHFVAVEK